MELSVLLGMELGFEKECILMQEPQHTLEVESVCARARTQLASFPKFRREALLRIVAKETMSRVRRTGSVFESVRFSWPQAFLALSLAAHDSAENRKAIRRYVARWEKSGSPLHHLDMAMIGHSYFHLRDHGNSDGYQEAINKISNFLASRRRDSRGSIVYREGRPLIFIDSIGITCPLLIRLSHETGDQGLLAQALLQVENFWTQGFQASTGLPYHAFDSDGAKSGIVGWGRGVGWAVLGLAQMIEYSAGDRRVQEALVPKLEGLLRVAQRYQLEDGAFTWQLQATEGPTDSSATGMITYAAALGVRRGWIRRDEFSDGVSRGIQSLSNTEHNGIVRLASGECEGVGRYPQVYGEYPWGTAAYLLAASAAGPRMLSSSKIARG